MKSLLFSLFMLLCLVGNAQSPIGTWKTIDDESGDEKSYIEIYEKSDGKIYGKVIKLLPAATTDVCGPCPGDMKGKPLVGLDILIGLTKDGEEWNDGTIVDPGSGKEYSVWIALDGVDKLKVRGYIGFSLLGRTQYWYRLAE